MHLQSLVSLLFAFSSIVIAANTASYEALSKAAQKHLILGHQYGFKTAKGPLVYHQRLIVVKVTGATDALDVDAKVYEMFAPPDPGDPNYSKEAKGKKVQVGSYKEYDKKPWDCTRGKYTYKGEVLQSLSFDDIQQKGEELMIGKERYSTLTNNCRHYVQNLFQKIQARALLLQNEQLGRGIEVAVEKQNVGVERRWAA